MSAPLPVYSAQPAVDGWVILEIDLPDFTTGQLAMKASLVGTQEGDDAIRRFVAARAATQDVLREGF